MLWLDTVILRVSSSQNYSMIWEVTAFAHINNWPQSLIWTQTRCSAAKSVKPLVHTDMLLKSDGCWNFHPYFMKILPLPCCQNAALRGEWTLTNVRWIRTVRETSIWFPCVTDLSLMCQFWPSPYPTQHTWLFVAACQQNQPVFPLHSFVTKYYHGRGLAFSFRPPAPLAVEEAKVDWSVVFHRVPEQQWEDKIVDAFYAGPDMSICSQQSSHSSSLWHFFVSHAWEKGSTVQNQTL